MTTSAEPADTLVDASRLIAASRSATDIIALATRALGVHTGALQVQFIDPTLPEVGMTPPSAAATTPSMASAIRSHEVRGHGRVLGRFELVFPITAANLGAEIDETISLIATVAGTALAIAGSATTEPTPPHDRRTPPRGDRRRMDRDFIDHTRNGQVGFIVLRLLCDTDDPTEVESMVMAAASLVDEAIRQNDVTYVSGPCELSILLPGATKPEAAMAADRIRSHLEAAWSETPTQRSEGGRGEGGRGEGGRGEGVAGLGYKPATAVAGPDHPVHRQPLRLIGGVSAGRHEDPQRLAERALDALDEAALIGANAIVTDLGA